MWKKEDLPACPEDRLGALCHVDARCFIEKGERVMRKIFKIAASALLATSMLSGYARAGSGSSMSMSLGR
jgi:hypothetical protein